MTAFLDHPAIDEVVVALPAEVLADPPPYLRVAAKPLSWWPAASGGRTRWRTRLPSSSESAAIIVIHDAARPFVSADLIARTIAAAVESGAAIAALQARDTVKQAERATQVDGRGGCGGRWSSRRRCRATTIYLAQTPQAFRRDVLRDALALAGQGVEATDEAALAERAGHRVRLVEGEPSNIKITTPRRSAGRGSDRRTARSRAAR